MGSGRLIRFANCASADMAGALAALMTELRAAVWCCREDLLRSYPSARIDGQHVEIDVGEDCPVQMLVNFEAHCVLIESAGLQERYAR